MRLERGWNNSQLTIPGHSQPLPKAFSEYPVIKMKPAGLVPKKTPRNHAITSEPEYSCRKLPNPCLTKALVHVGCTIAWLAVLE